MPVRKTQTDLTAAMSPTRARTTYADDHLFARNIRTPRPTTSVNRSVITTTVRDWHKVANLHTMTPGAVVAGG